MSTSGGNYRQSLTKALSYESPLDFASGGTFTQCPLVPGVAIDGYGVIGLPVHPHVINELIKLYRPTAPQQEEFTMKDASETTTTSKEALQIDASRIHITNPEWDAALASLISEVAMSLDWGNEVRLHLEGLSLVQPGGGNIMRGGGEEELPAAAPAASSTRSNNKVFGRLVITLPTSFQGGALVVSWKGKSRTFDVCLKSAFKSTFAAFWTECQYEFLPVTEGCRLSLTYNVIYTGSGNPPSLTLDPMALIEEGVEEWRQDVYGPVKLIFPLAHSIYTGHRFSFDMLRDRDKMAGASMMAAAKQGKVLVYLGILSSRELCIDTRRTQLAAGASTTGLDSAWEVKELELGVELIVDPDGHRPEGAKKMAVNSRDLLGDANNFLQDPDVAAERFMGQHQGLRERLYRQPVLVFWPLAQQLRIMVDIGAKEYSIISLVDKMGEDGTLSPDALPLGVTSANEWLRALLPSLGTPLAQNNLTNENAPHWIIATSRIGDFASLCRVLELADLTTVTKKSMANALYIAAARFGGWSPLIPAIRSSFINHSNAPLAARAKALGQLASFHPLTSFATEMLRDLALRFREEHTQSRAMAVESFVNLYTTLVALQQIDTVIMLINSLISYPADFPPKAFWLPVLCGLVKHSQQPSAVRSYPGLDSMMFMVASQCNACFQEDLGPVYALMWAMDQLGWDNIQADQLLSQALWCAQRAVVNVIQPLKTLVAVSRRANTLPSFQRMVQTALEAVVHTLPKPPAVIQLNCDCQVCMAVNASLRDPSSLDALVPQAGAHSGRRKHVKELLEKIPQHAQQIQQKGHATSFRLTKTSSVLATQEQYKRLYERYAHDRKLGAELRSLLPPRPPTAPPVVPAMTAPQYAAINTTTTTTTIMDGEEEEEEEKESKRPRSSGESGGVAM